MDLRFGFLGRPTATATATTTTAAATATATTAAATATAAGTTALLLGTTLIARQRGAVWPLAVMRLSREEDFKSRLWPRVSVGIGGIW